MSDRINIKYTPSEIKVEEISSNTNLTGSDLANLKIANKLVRHLDQIREYKDRVDAIDYLIKSAKEKSGNPTFTTEDAAIKSAIQKMSGIKDLNSVDFELFSKCVDIIIKSYEEQALVSITGVLNA